MTDLREGVSFTVAVDPKEEEVTGSAFGRP